MWVLGFEPRFPRPQRGVLTTRRYPHIVLVGQLMVLLKGRLRSVETATVSERNEDSLDTRLHLDCFQDEHSRIGMQLFGYGLMRTV